MFIFLNLFFISIYLFFSFYFLEFNYLLLEDSLIEFSGAIFLFASSIFLAFATIKYKPQANLLQKSLLLGYCFFMFLAAGEEASWGQRIFNVKTPEAISKINMQGELNLHNLEIFNRRDRNGDKTGLALFLSAEMLYNLIAVGLFVFLPLVKKWSGPFKTLIPDYNFMIPLILSFTLMKVCLMYFGNIQSPLVTLQRGLGEIKETLLSTLFALHGLRLALSFKK